MRIFIERVVDRLSLCQSVVMLRDALEEITGDLGYDYFALAHHVDAAQAGPHTVRLHNYPPRWVEFFDQHALAVKDPIHRAAQATSIGFRWRDVASLVTLTAFDRAVLRRALDEGIGDGFTVPAHVPGEVHGSCSFALRSGRDLSDRNLPLAQLAGAFAFEGARRLTLGRARRTLPPTPLTDRQRDCVIWVARGKTDWEIGRILGVSEETVVRHVKDARERYGLSKRTSLLIQTLFDGTISFDDIVRR